MLKIQRKLTVLLFCVSLHYAFVKATEESNKPTDGIKPNINEEFENYLKNLSDDLQLDVGIVLTRAEYYNDGTVKQMDALAFSSNADKENQNFNISSISKQDIDKLVTYAEDKGLLMSLHAEKMGQGKSKKRDFHTERLVAPKAPSAVVALHPGGFEKGLGAEIDRTLDLALNVGTVEVLEYYDNGHLKRNRTTTIYTKPIIIHKFGKMSKETIQESKPVIVSIMKKAYKVDISDRASLIRDLLNFNLDDYEWQVLVNVTTFKVPNDAEIRLSVGPDYYAMFGKEIPEVDEE